MPGMSGIPGIPAMGAWARSPWEGASRTRAEAHREVRMTQQKKGADRLGIRTDPEHEGARPQYTDEPARVSQGGRAGTRQVTRRDAGRDDGRPQRWAGCRYGDPDRHELGRARNGKVPGQGALPTRVCMGACLRGAEDAAEAGWQGMSRAAMLALLAEPLPVILDRYRTATRLPGPIKRRVREVLLAEHGAGCTYCHQLLCLESATLDHVTPLARGGTNARDNLVLACARCNTAKGQRPGPPVYPERTRARSERRAERRARVRSVLAGAAAARAGAGLRAPGA